MTSTSLPDFPAKQTLYGLLEKQLPGSSAASVLLRRQLLGAIGDLSVRTVLLLGPIGVGKSSLARLLAFGKRIAPLREEEAGRMTADLRFEGPGLIDVRAMPWFVELPLTGLVPTLADSQLFGSTKGAYTNAQERPGVFEQASSGRGGSLAGGSGVTGGVVFLDEIGDLPDEIQAKLLPVLSGGKFYRLGGEGNSNHEHSFRGILISASWREPLNQKVRADLLSRLSESVIRVPSLSDRRSDLPDLILSIEMQAKTRLEKRIQEILRSDPAADRIFYQKLLEDKSGLTPADREHLADIDWGKRGELRGLTQIIERVMFGSHQVEQALELTSPNTASASSDQKSVQELIKWLHEQEPDGRGLAGHIAEFENSKRAELAEYLAINSLERHTLAEKLGIPESSLRNHLRQLARSRLRVQKAQN